MAHEEQQNQWEPRLLKRLWRALSHPGLIDLNQAELILARAQRMSSGLPLAERLNRRWFAATDEPSEALPIVYLQPRPMPTNASNQATPSKAHPGPSHNPNPALARIKGKMRADKATHEIQVKRDDSAQRIPHEVSDLSGQGSQTLVVQPKMAKSAPLASELPTKPKDNHSEASQSPANMAPPSPSRNINTAAMQGPLTTGLSESQSGIRPLGITTPGSTAACEPGPSAEPYTVDRYPVSTTRNPAVAPLNRMESPLAAPEMPLEAQRQTEEYDSTVPTTLPLVQASTGRDDGNTDTSKRALPRVRPFVPGLPNTDEGVAGLAPNRTVPKTLHRVQASSKRDDGNTVDSSATLPRVRSFMTGLPFTHGTTGPIRPGSTSERPLVSEQITTQAHRRRSSQYQPLPLASASPTFAQPQTAGKTHSPKRQALSATGTDKRRPSLMRPAQRQGRAFEPVDELSRTQHRASPLDINGIVNKVQRQFLRRLTVEGERRGVRRWP